MTDADGKPLALFYCDYFKRDNKSGGAWTSSFVRQSKLLGTLPVVYNVANLPEARAGQPALITFTDVTTMFHEFGHALHAMFNATRVSEPAGKHSAGFCGGSVAVQRALGIVSGGVCALCEALQDGRGDAGRTGGENQEGGVVQPGLYADGDPGGGGAGYAVAHADGRCATAGCRRV